MLPVTALPPNFPGSWCSSFGLPTQIVLLNYNDPRPGMSGNGLFVLPKGCWLVITDAWSIVQLTYTLIPYDVEFPPYPPASQTQGIPAAERRKQFRVVNSEEQQSGWTAPQRRQTRSPPSEFRAAVPPPHPLPVWLMGQPPLPPLPGGDYAVHTLLPNTSAGVVFADGQNVTLNNAGYPIIMEIFSV